MKLDKKLIVGLAAAMLTAGIAYLGSMVQSIPSAVTAGAVAIVAWLAAWINGRDNT